MNIIYTILSIGILKFCWKMTRKVGGQKAFEFLVEVLVRPIQRVLERVVSYLKTITVYVYDSCILWNVNYVWERLVVLAVQSVRPPRRRVRKGLIEYCLVPARHRAKVEV